MHKRYKLGLGYQTFLFINGKFVEIGKPIDILLTYRTVSGKEN